MKKLLFIAAFAIALAPAAYAAPKTISPQGHQPVRAEVTNDDPQNFTINLKKLANLGVNKKAKTYALYTTASLPDKCADFRGDSIDYQKPNKYTRVFDMSKKPEVIKALNDYGCVVIPNKPKLPPAKS